ncbi:MAG: UvrD-helicase domain-containing protein [Firmicutes bacterium]|nr:UvrD-helicase domain-containing protein [Bacillota bacterium]
MASYTPQQEQAIFDLDRSLVVTAGAGSGKTRVLVGRYLNILEEQAADIDEVIAITFTEKAANEMKGRAWEEIIKREKKAGSPEEARRWRDLARRLQSARISTIDSFCAQLVREYPIEAGVDPEFAIMDELDMRRAMYAAARLAVDKMLQRKDPYMTALVVDKGFGVVAEALCQAFEKLRMTGRPFEECLGVTMASLDRSEAEAERALTNLKLVLLAAAESKGVPVNIDHLKLAGVQPGSPELLEVSGLIFEIDAVAAGLKLKKRSDEQKQIDELKAVLYECLLDRFAREGVRSVVDACKLMDEEYRAQRGDGAMMDFTGIELAARDLLRDTPAGEACRSRFKFVLVDEYQDTNRLQDEIVSLITGEPYGNRRFVVGDPKQSIYRFRGAVVEVFEEAVRAAVGDAAGPAGGAAGRCGRVELGANFRSVGPLVDVTNALFAKILGSERFSPAKSHRTAPSPCIPRAELMLVRLEGKEKGPKGELEAEVVARRIAEMVGNDERLVCETIVGADGPMAVGRPVGYGDIAVLLRATTHMKEFEAALSRHGVPYYVVGGAGFYGRPEVIWLVDLLRAIDDRSDVTSLAAVLRSPVFGLSDESLLRLKVAAGSLDRAVWGSEVELGASSVAGTAGAVTGSNGADTTNDWGLVGAELAKFRRACTCLGTLAAAVGRMPVGGLVKAAIELGGFEEYFAFAEQGAQSIGNLRKLAQMAEDETSTRSCLHDFITDMEFAGDLSAREAEAAMEEESANTVKVMTVHKSKGLEFPVVFVPELARPARRSGGGLFEYSPSLGLAAPVQVGDEWCDATRHLRAAREEIRAGDDEEGKRCLYVAATRASDYLVGSATLPGPGSRARSSGGPSWYEHLCSAIPELGEETAGEANEAHPSCGSDSTDLPDTVVVDDETGAAIFVRHYQELDIRELMQATEGPLDEAAAGRDNQTERAGREATRPRDEPPGIAEFAPLAGPVRIVAGAAGAPIQFSVSALMCLSHCARWYLYEYVYRLGRIPRDLRNAFEVELQLTAAVRGQVVHSVCERCGQATDSAQARALLLDELHLRGADSVLACSVADELMPMVDTFLRRYPGPSRGGQREIGFLMDVGGPVVSGVMDRVDVLPDGSVLVVDFKTNRVRGPAVDEAAARYVVQLDAYAVAAARVYGADRVTARLHFLYPDEVRDRSYGPAELLQAAEGLGKLAGEASRHNLRNTPIRRIAECDRCYFAQLCGFTPQSPHGTADHGLEDEILPVLSPPDDDVSPES